MNVGKDTHASSEGIPEHPGPRNGFHIASPAVELTFGVSLDQLSGTGSDSQYSHWPWSLQMRAWSFPWRRSLPIDVRPIPSFVENVSTVSLRGSMSRYMRLSILD